MPDPEIKPQDDDKETIPAAGMAVYPWQTLKREKVTRYDRVRYVAGLILLGYRERQIVKMGSERFNVPRQFLGRDIRAVRLRWQEQGGPQMDRLRTDTLGRALETVLISFKAMAEDPTPKQITATVKAQEFLARLLGMDRGVPKLTLQQNNLIVPITQGDIGHDGQPLKIQWATKEQMQPQELVEKQKIVEEAVKAAEQAIVN